MPWMTTLYNTVGGFPNRDLSQITIPGTHDAGCYVNHNLNYASRTQTQDIAGQLAGGIRYFDLRPYQANTFSGREFWTFHGPFYTGGRLDGAGGIFDQVDGFMNGLAGTDRELVILNISHFGRLVGFGNADHQALIAEIQLRLGNHLLPYTQAQVPLFSTPYGLLLSTPGGGGLPPGVPTNPQSRVVILYDGALDTNREGYITTQLAGPGLPAGFFTVSPKYAPPANQIFVFDQYSNTADVGTLRTNQIAKLTNRTAYPYSTRAWAAGMGNWPANAQGGVADTLHLFSWTLTPQPSDPVTEAATKSNPALPTVFSVGTRVNAANGTPHPCKGVTNWAAWNYDPAADPQINILYVDNFGSHVYDNPASPFNGLALPVAFAAQLNQGPIWPMTW